MAAIHKQSTVPIASHFTLFHHTATSSTLPTGIRIKYMCTPKNNHLTLLISKSVKNQPNHSFDPLPFNIIYSSDYFSITNTYEKIFINIFIPKLMCVI